MRNSRLRLISLACLTLIAGAGAAWLMNRPISGLSFHVTSDMDKATGDGAVENSGYVYDEARRTVSLHGAGNEVVAFQLVLTSTREEHGLDVRVQDWIGETATLPAAQAELFLAHYAKPHADADYSWGPGGGGVLPWKGIAWPDALIPWHDPYSGGNEAVAAPFSIMPEKHRNQAVWVDVWIPAGTPAGQYASRLDLIQAGTVLSSLTLALTVHPFDLPAESHVDAYGELYRETGLMFDTGVKFRAEPEREWAISQRYMQMGHAHRFLATHRGAEGPMARKPNGEPAAGAADAWGEDWGLFTPYAGKAISGELFTAEHGYRGPSAGAATSFYPAPFPEVFYGSKDLMKHLNAHGGQIDPQLLQTWKSNAASFWAEAGRQGWQDRRFFAYLLDEVDGGNDTGDEAGDPNASIQAMHDAMRAIQQALDEGTGGPHINLLWTSHAHAAQWAETPLDLRGVISWWAPNADALDPAFFAPFARSEAETVWFYHSGQPATGNHTINQLGIDLRLWGLLCVRYGVEGSFWWSMMSFARPWNDAAYNPYAIASYNANDTRWGNGVLFYPGSRLEQAGARRAIAGPVSSMRMKAYRRGLQDYEYCWLARERGRGEQVDALLKTLIPKAFAEAAGTRKGAWSHNPAEYERARTELAKLIAE